MDFSWLTGREAPKPAVAELPPLVSDVDELVKEHPAFERGCIALDVTFDKNGTPYILEIQGTDAGVKGIEEELERGEINPHLQKLAKEWDRVKAQYTNPQWYREVTYDKTLQPDFIPEANRPKTITTEDFDELFTLGPVIIKPAGGAQGRGIKIFSREESVEAHAYAKSLIGQGGFVAQQFVESRGAELAPNDLKGHPSSLRLILPFKTVNGKTKIAVSGFGYQRVARYAPHEVGSKVRGRRIKGEDVGVVNLARDAAAVPMSKAENEKVLPIADEIIERFQKFGTTTPEYRADIARKLSQRASRVVEDIRRKYPFLNVYHYQKYDEDLDDVKKKIEFFRFLERECAIAEPGFLSQRKISKIQPTISLSEDGKFAEARIWNSGEKRYRFPLTPGAFQRFLDEYSRRRVKPIEEPASK